MRRLIMASLLLITASRAAAADKNEGAVATVTGRQACAHCEFGVGDSCCPGLVVGESVIVIEGKAGDALFDSRQSGGIRRAKGALAIQEGVLYLRDAAAEAIDDNEKKAAVSIIALVVKGKDGLTLANGKSPIRVKGPAAAKLAENVDAKVRVTGDVGIDASSQIILTAERIEPAKKKGS